MNREEQIELYKSKFSDSLQELMLQKGISLAELSREINIDYEILDKFIKKIYLPSATHALKLANFFECNLQYLFGREINKTKIKIKLVNNFYSNFKEVIKRNKKSMYKISKDLRFSRSITEKWKGGSFPRLSTIMLMADYLGISIDDLLCEK